MCGIFCYICRMTETNKLINGECDNVQWRLIENNIANRGPDSLANHSQKLHEEWLGKFIGSVLWMQGPKVISQPCIDNEGNILLWNGDIFSGLLATDNNSDTLALLMKLKSSCNIIKTINSIEGPFSIIYFQKSTNLLYFSRDKIGRHSLLIKVNQENQSLTLCSVANKCIDDIVELPAIGIFVIDLQCRDINLSYYPWETIDEQVMDTLKKFEQQIHLNIEIKLPIIERICDNIILEPNPDELLPLEELSNSKNIDETMRNFQNNFEISKRITHLLKLLRESIKIRVKKTPEYCKNCIKDVIANKTEINCGHPKIGILFSGGLDSTILAAIANEFIPIGESIDLINVAFEKARGTTVNNNKNFSTSTKFDVPDRKTGQQALNELKQICPNRTWNFIEVNVNRAELQTYCQDRICNLIYPLKTILDESLGCAIWFASRGSGILSSTNELYESSCRILLLGMGADELFGGYTRHRTTLRRNGWEALTKELQKELMRISERNLGRDDRVVSDHGRQSRLPYLDENLVRYVQNLKAWERCYPTEKLSTGIGDKLLLRLVAYKIGLRTTANFPKRALQFGSRIADSKQNANDLSSWLR